MPIDHRRSAAPSFPGRSSRSWLLAAGLALGLAACGGGGSDGGGGGGGSGSDAVQIRGTVPANRRLATRELEIRAASGERSRATIGTDGRFEAGALQGSGPYLLRASFGDGEAWYALAELDAAGATTANVHAYTDLAVRSAAASTGASIDAMFEAEGATPAGTMPEAATVRAIGGAIGDILAPSLAAYGLEGTDLAEVPFSADGQSVDKFLAENPAVVENDAFTILGTDPVTDTRTVVSEQVPLSRDLLASDTVPPDAPPELRALPAASNEIVLVWEPAKDDVGVARYEVLRDGQAIATTPYPVHADLPLAGGVDYTYTVIAIDGAGNRSDATPGRVASPLGEADTTPPPRPTGVSVTVTNSTARVGWTQTGVADVAAFRVLRSVGGGMLAAVTRSTSTALTDVDLSAATDYCYQVIAIDASENASEPSELVCRTTDGTGMLTRPLPPVSMPPTPVPPVVPITGGAAAALLALDVSGVACDLEVESSTVSTALTLDAPCYRVPSGLTVAENGRLTLAPGTVLKFGAGRGLRVNQGGSLTARGTAAAPVVLSGLERTPGFWSGVQFVFANSNANVLENVLIEYAGNARGAALTSTSGTSSPVRLAARSVALRESAGAGFEVSRNTILDDFTDIVSTANAVAGSIAAEVAGQIVPPVAFGGNTQDGVNVGPSSSDTIDVPTLWPATGSPWNVGGLTVNAPFELSPGSVLRFTSGARIRVNTDGSLRALGTADAPILLTGREPTPGFWRGVNFVFSNSVDNTLRHVTVEYAGGLSSSDGQLASVSSPNSPARLALEDVTLRSGLGPGFRFGNALRLTTFDRVTSTGNDLAGVFHPEWVPATVTAPALSGNTDDTVHLLDATIRVAATWPALGVPYRIEDVQVNAPLTIAAGTDVIADSGAEIRVNSDGSLNAVGTAAAPITFTGASALPGFWDGLYFVFSDSPLNRLEHVTIRHGGQGRSETRGNVTLLCTRSSQGRLALANATLADGAGWGIYRSGAGCNVELDATTTLAGNAEGAINPIEP